MLFPTACLHWLDKPGVLCLSKDGLKSVGFIIACHSQTTMFSFHSLQTNHQQHFASITSIRKANIGLIALARGHRVTYRCELDSLVFPELKQGRIKEARERENTQETYTWFCVISLLRLLWRDVVWMLWRCSGLSLRIQALSECKHQPHTFSWGSKYRKLCCLFRPAWCGMGNGKWR